MEFCIFEISGRRKKMSFGIYIMGFLLLIGGLAYGAFLLNIPERWIIVGAIILLGLGIATGATATRHKDPSA